MVFLWIFGTRKFVPIEGWFLFKSFATIRADETHYIRVDLHVSSQQLLGLKAVATLIALMVSILIMNRPLVALQALGLDE